LSKIIVATGWRAPITVSKLSGLIVRGHCRYEAAVEAGILEVPVDYQGYESEEQELADLLADNRVAELAETDKATLREVLGLLDDEGYDLEMAGYETMIDELIDEATAEAEEAAPQIDLSVDGEIEPAVPMIRTVMFVEAPIYEEFKEWLRNKVASMEEAHGEGCMRVIFE
jgi:ParB-like chromosome segregation protein Spo0J